MLKISFLVRGELEQVSTLKDKAKEFIANPKKREDLAEKPTKAIISLKNDRGTNYETYLEVYNELKAAYNELWNEESRKEYGKDYSEELANAHEKGNKIKDTFCTFRSRTNCFW